MGEADIPDWATIVVSRTERNATGVTYTVFLQNEEADDDCDVDGLSRGVWSKEVFFGATDAFYAGGYAFREAALEQEKVAERYAAAIRGRR